MVRAEAGHQEVSSARWCGVPVVSPASSACTKGRLCLSLMLLLLLLCVWRAGEGMGCWRRGVCRGREEPDKHRGANAQEPSGSTSKAMRFAAVWNCAGQLTQIQVHDGANLWGVAY